MFHRMMNYGKQEVRPTLTLTRDLIKKLMPKYKRFDDLIVVQDAAWEEFKKSLLIPVVREENSPFSIDEDELASILCQTIQKPICNRLLVERGVKNDDYRSPEVELILGEDAIVTHKENQITYKFDLEKCMFSRGNLKEKMRLSELDCSDEIIVDLFAGIGYFTLSLLVHANAKHLYACEWNPDAIQALKTNLNLNKIDLDRCTVIEGDNRSNRPTNVAQRVILGILPSCKDWMKTAFECVNKKTGAILHCHDLVETTKLTSSDHAQILIDCIKEEVESHDLNIRLIHTQIVKSYAPHIDHVVFDIKIEPRSLTTVTTPLPTPIAIPNDEAVSSPSLPEPSVDEFVRQD